MHLDAHYYGILAFAAACGFKKESAQTLAHASQFVDDAKINQLTINEPTYGIPLDCESPPCLINMSTCHSYFRIKTFNEAAMINNTCAFHFVPGCKGNSFAWKMVCEPGGPILQKIKEDVLQENDLIKFGIFLHAWADSFSHQGFSGLLSKTNNIDHLHADSKVYLYNSPYLSFIVLWLRRKIFSGSFDNIFDYLVPAYGHAQALHYPDEPYLEKWSYIYDEHDINYQGHIPDPKNNLASYRKAFESITDLLKQFLRNHPAHINFESSDSMAPPEQLYKTLLMGKNRKKRVNEWLITLSNLKLFTKVELENLKYKEYLWIADAFKNFKTDKHLFKDRRIVEGAILKETFAESNWYKFYLAVRWYKKLFHKYCSEAGLVFDHEPYYP